MGVLKKYKRSFFLLASYFIWQVSFAQTIFSDWAVSKGTKGWDIVNGIATDTSGNLLILGSLANHSGDDFISKYDTSGKEIWKKQLNPSEEGYLNQIIVDKKNNLIVAGTKDIGKHKCDYFLSSLDSTGSEIWRSTFSGSRLNYTTSLGLDESSGNISLGGYFYDTLTIAGKKYYPSGKSDALLLLFDKEGNLIKSAIFGGAGQDKISSIYVTSDGSIIVIGTFQKKLKISKKSIVVSGSEETGIFSAVFDKNLTCTSLRKIASGGKVEVSSLKEYNNGFCIAGTFSGEIKIDPTRLLSTGSDDIFLAFLNKDFSLRNLKQFGGEKKDKCAGIIAGKDNIILTGSIASEIQIHNNKIKPAGNGADAFVASFNSEGKIRWFKSLGGKADDYPVSLLQSGPGYIYLTGSYRDTFDIQTRQVASTGEEDLFIARIQECDEIGPKFKQPELICRNASLILDAGDGYKTYEWDNGVSMKQEFEIIHDGIYPLFLTTNNGCYIFDTINVVLAPENFPFIGNDTTIFDTTVLILKTTGKYQDYRWSNDSTDAFIIVNGSDLNEGINLLWLKTIDENGCESEDDILIEMQRTETIDISKFNCQLSPNPTDGPLNIKITNSGEQTGIKIFNSLGQIVDTYQYSSKEKNQAFDINLGSLAPGFYTLLISQNKNIVTRKIMVQ